MTGPQIQDRCEHSTAKIHGISERTLKTAYKRNLLATALVCTLAVTTVPSRAEVTPADSSAVALAKEEARAIATEAYIYGFPLVDGYRIQYAYYVDSNNPEFKAPWNEIRNMPRVFTSEDRAVQTPTPTRPIRWLVSTCGPSRSC